MFEKTLPIGSVVLLKNATKRLMIVTRQETRRRYMITVAVPIRKGSSARIRPRCLIMSRLPRFTLWDTRMTSRLRSAKG